jgi:UDP:flavonoid glycosyltransferase YjiC (YdhE family)
MRILFTISPQPGHLRIIRPTIQAAVRAGHDIVVATGPDLLAATHRDRFVSWGVGPAAWQIRSDFGRRPRRSDPVAQRDALNSAFHAQPALGRLTDLLPRAAAWSPELVIHDISDVAGVELAVRLGIPHIAHGVDQHGDSGWLRLPMVTDELARAWGTGDRWSDLTQAPFLDPSLWPGRPLPFGNVVSVQPGADAGVRTRRLPLRVQRFPYERTVLVAVEPAHIDTVLAGLSGFQLNVLLDTGSVEVAQLGALPDHVAAGQDLPLDLALPDSIAVISGGRSEVLTAAMTHGLPQLTVPLWTARRLDAARLARHGAGITLHPERLQPGTVRRALGDLLAAPAYANAARGLSEVIHGMPTAEQALDLLLTRVPV